MMINGNETKYNDFALAPLEQMQEMSKEFGKTIRSYVLNLDDFCKLNSKVFALHTEQLSNIAHNKFAQLNETLNSLLKFSLNPTTKQTIMSLIDEQKNIYQKFGVAFKTNGKIQTTKTTSSNFFGIIKSAIILVLEIILNLINIKTADNNLEKEQIFDMLLKDLTEFVTKVIKLL